MEYSKTQRHIIYKAALRQVKELHCTYMCDAINRALNGKACYPAMKINFPELWKQKPKKLFEKSSVECWFDPDDRKTRVKILTACVKQTAPKKKKSTDPQENP